MCDSITFPSAYTVLYMLEVIVALLQYLRAQRSGWSVVRGGGALQTAVFFIKVVFLLFLFLVVVIFAVEADLAVVRLQGEMNALLKVIQQGKGHVG